MEMELPSDPSHLGDAQGLMASQLGGNQLTLSFQGEVFVFDSVFPEKVQAVLLLLGGRAGSHNTDMKVEKFVVFLKVLGGQGTKMLETVGAYLGTHLSEARHSRILNFKKYILLLCSSSVFKRRMQRNRGSIYIIQNKN
ncbi:unnamed protein product [Musa acuminata var. zebrina]